jgi:hypothetical protein
MYLAHTLPEPLPTAFWLANTFTSRTRTRLLCPAVCHVRPDPRIPFTFAIGVPVNVYSTPAVVLV